MKEIQPVALGSDILRQVDEFFMNTGLKLASGLSAKHRELRDLADVQQLIETLRLPEDLSERLDGSVRNEYRRLWTLAQQARAEAKELAD